MITIRLFCNLGMSTSLLVESMKQAAQQRGIEADIEAFPVNEMAERVENADAALLGPQVGYLKAKSAEICGRYQVPLEVIPTADYGLCNGGNVLEFAIRMTEKQQEAEK